MNSEATHVCVLLTTASSIKLPSNLPYITIIMICFLMTDAGGRTCTCGVKQVSNVTTDIGDAGNWPFFPILSFNIGDTGHTWEYAQYVLGPLICKQGDQITTYSFVANNANYDNSLKPKYIFLLDLFNLLYCQCTWEELISSCGYSCVQAQFMSTTNLGKITVVSYILFFLSNPAAIVYRWFDTNPGMRQTVDVTIDDWATTASKCAMSCLNNNNCISFNFMMGGNPICELSSLPRDAQSANYRNDAGWSHYNIRLN